MTTMRAEGLVPLAGDWTHSGLVRLGVYRPSALEFFLDVDGQLDFANHMSILNFAQTGDLPVTGHFECTP